jgi:hypothetical protein
MAIIVKEKEYIVIREGVAQSWAKDIFTFVMLGGLFYLNAAFCGESTVINVTIAFCFIILCVGIGNRKALSLDEAIAKLQAMKKAD